MGTKKKIDVCLVVDRSNSLKHVGDTINASLVTMLEEVKQSPYLHGCDVYFTMVSFNHEMAKNIDFVPIDSVSTASLKLTYESTTNPGPALRYIFNETCERCERWKAAGEEAFWPLILFFTDGSPYPEEDYMSEYREVARLIRGKESEEKLTVICAGYGDANIDNLNLMTSKSEHVLKMSDNVDKLKGFFQEIIPVTISTFTRTGTVEQIVDVFVSFTNS